MASAPLSVNSLPLGFGAPLLLRFNALDLVWPLTVRTTFMCQIGAPATSTNLLRMRQKALLSWGRITIPAAFSPSRQQRRLGRQLILTVTGGPITSFSM